MGDKLVEAICTVLEDAATSNGISRSQMRPIVDAMVNTLRKNGMADDDIAAWFGRADYQE